MSGGGIPSNMQGTGTLGNPTNMMGQGIMGGMASGAMPMPGPVRQSMQMPIHPTTPPPIVGNPMQQPIQSPPQGGIQGNPAYSVGHYPQPTGGYWNQIAQQLAGPQYQQKAPPKPAIPGMPGSVNGSPNMAGTLPYWYGNFPGYGL